MTLPILPGFATVAARYDGFILDLWGVIHDGRTAYPGAIDCLTRLKELGKRVVFLSNAPRRAGSLATLLAGMGIAPTLYGAIVSSGETVRQELLTRRDPWFAALGRDCLHIGPAHDLDLVAGIDLTLLSGPKRGGFLLNTGPGSADETVSSYRPLLDRAAALDMKMICANPDLVVMHHGRSMICAGSLAAYYQQIGGELRYRGKPDPAIYRDCLEYLGIADKRRVLAVGDAFHTDMAGATASGLDGLFCSGGIHAEALGTRYGQSPDPDRLAALLAEHPGPAPVAVVAGLCW
jgi:HAD superfamily hydrolase (TIGR01459 family)